MHSVKQAARELIDGLPESTSWNDVMYDLYAKQKIEEGLKELDEGRGSRMRMSSAACSATQRK